MEAVAENIKAPELRFPKFEGSWGEKCLEEVSRIYDGTHQTPRYVKSGIPFYSVEHVTSGDFSRTKFIEPIVHERECRRVKMDQGDVLMTRIGSVGVPKLIDWKVEASFYVSLALIKPQNCLLGSYLCQSIAAPSTQREIWKRQIHVAFPKKINLGDIGKVIFHLPSIPEQQKIADFLTAVDERIAKLKRKKELLEIYKKGMMQKLFSQEIRFKDDDGSDFPDWEEKTFGSTSVIKRGASPRPISSPKWFNDQSTVGWVRITDVTNSGKHLTETAQFVSEAGIAKSRFVPSGSLIMSICATLGKPVQTAIDVCIHDGFVVFESPSFDLDFAYFYLLKIQRHWSRYGQPGIQLNLNSTIVAEEPIYLPVISEQRKIAQFLTGIDDKITVDANQIDKAAEFKRGLLQKMFV